MVFAGFNRRKKGSISNGDWDRDGVRNRKDCEPLNFRKQGPEHDSYNKDMDDENRRMRKKLKFEGNKKALKAVKKENQEEYFTDGNDYTY